METVIEIAGWCAAGVLLCAYVLLSRGRLSGQASSYQTLNVVGSLLIGVNSLAHEAWPSVSINVVWLAIGIITLVTARQRTAQEEHDGQLDVDGQPSPREDVSGRLRPSHGA